MGIRWIVGRYGGIWDGGSYPGGNFDQSRVRCSALVSLIANSVPTAFGAVGVPVIVLAQETGLPVIPLSTAVVLQLSVLMLLVPLVITFLADPRMKALPKNLLLSLLVGGVSLATQYLAARYIGAETPAIVGAIASIIVIVVIGKLTGKGGEKPIPMTYSGGEVFKVTGRCTC